MSARQSEQLIRIFRKTDHILRCTRLAKIIAPAVIVAFFYVFLSFLTLPQKLPDSLRLLLIVIFIGVGTFSVVATARHTRERTREERARLIEDASDLPKYSLQTFVDQPAHVAYTSHALWQYHKKRRLQTLPPLKTPFPHLTPYAFFLSITFAILLGADGLEYTLSQPFSYGRLKAGLVPGYDDPSAPYPDVNLSFTTPPWGQTPELITTSSSKRYKVTQASRLHLHIHNFPSPPHLMLAGEHYNAVPDEAHRTNMATNWVISAPIRHNSTVFLRGRGRLLDTFDLSVQSDPPAQIDWEEAPYRVPNTQWTAFSLKASHPFGIARLQLDLRNRQNPREFFKHFNWEIPQHPTHLYKNMLLDMARYDWANQEISAQLHVTSVSGETASSPTLFFYPNVIDFTAPTAEKLIRLKQDYNRAPDLGETLADQLRQLLLENKFFQQHKQYLVTALYCAMLMDSQDPTDPQDIQQQQKEKVNDLLWYLARDIQYSETNSR